METTNPRKSGALILNNLIMFNEAELLLEQQIKVDFFEPIQEIINNKTTENKQQGYAEWYHKEENKWMSPKECFFSEEDQLHLATF